MIKYSSRTSLQFDDILLVPQYSNIGSRSQVDISMKGLKLPVVASPMDTVCEYKMANKINEFGGLAFIHRYMDKSEQLTEVQMVEGKRGIAIASIDVFDTQYILDALDLGVRYFCIDTANGHNKAAIEAVRFLRNIVPDDAHIMAGNVATSEGFKELANVGVNSVRVGIGGGSVCTTRLVTGHGVPTLQSIMDCYEAASSMINPPLIVADGGIRNTGDIVKSFAAGADWVMLGSMLAASSDTPGDIVMQGDEKYKRFRGMASKEAQNEWRGYVSVAEGAATLVKYKGETEDIIKQIIGGIKSGCSYTGVDNLSDLKDAAMYVEVSGNTHKENVPHAKSRQGHE